MSDQLETLYNKFRKELAENDLSIYYDEGDLADIFDYAGDVHDDYIRLEVLMLGNRLFPDSEILLERRAIWLANMGNEPLRQFIVDHPRSNPSVMWEILRIRANAPYTNEDAITELENLLQRFRLNDDETIIQYVALVRHLEQEQWLISNLDFVRNHCEYPPTLLFEIARMAYNRTQSASALQLLEELTELDPFNTDYWGLMAELQSNCEQYDESLVSLDYAKALEPDNVELLTIEGFNYLKLNRIDDAIKTFEYALTLDCDYFIAKRNLLEAYRIKGESSKCKELISQLFRAEPSDTSLLCEMLISFPEEIDETLSHFYANSDADENEAIVHASELCRTGNDAIALQYIRWYNNSYSLSTQGKLIFIELMYHNGYYNEAYNYLIDNIKAPVLSPNELPVIAVIVSILMRLHIFDEALHFCDVWLKKLNTNFPEHNSFNLVNRGLVEILNDIKTLLINNPNPTDKQIESVTL
ncbi:MAG: hypothetical protein IKL83_04180 [Muribaculaceae bacterium]|nr:hypothetical protein [Muribaculaceae bacterium]